MTLYIVLSLELSVWEYCMYFNLEFKISNGILHIFQDYLPETKSYYLNRDYSFFPDIIKVSSCQFLECLFHINHGY